MAQELRLARPASGVMGRVVKGAPYSADEITETLQVLGDGTRISRHTQVTVYRDGEGRVRRESPTLITIFDPVANVSYSLDRKSMTAAKSTLGRAYLAGIQNDGEGKVVAGDYSQEAVQAKLDAESKAAAMLDKLKSELDARAMVVNGTPATPQTAAVLKEQLDQAMAKVSATGASARSKVEDLGQQVIEGMTADGTRTTLTIGTGEIGNDRPIQTVIERWYSADLQTVLQTKRTDPRSGEETFRLANVRRGEPGAELFQVPPGSYQLTPRKEQ